MLNLVSRWKYFDAIGQGRSWTFFKVTVILPSFNILFSDISSETTGPIEVKTHVEPIWVGRVKVCSLCLGHLTKMAATSIHGKNSS